MKDDIFSSIDNESVKSLGGVPNSMGKDIRKQVLMAEKQTILHKRKWTDDGEIRQKVKKETYNHL